MNKEMSIDFYLRKRNDEIKSFRKYLNKNWFNQAPATARLHRVV